MRKFLLLIGFICLFTGTALAQELKTFSENGYFGLKDSAGNVIVDAEFKKLIKIGNSSWLVQKRGKYGLIDNEGNYLVQPKYRHADRILGRFAKLGNDTDYGLYDETGKIILPAIYSSIELLYGNMFLTCKNYKFGVVDFEGNILLANEFEDIYMPTKDSMRVQYKGEWYEFEKISPEKLELPENSKKITVDNTSFTFTKLVTDTGVKSGYYAVSATDYILKTISSLSAAYEQTIDDLMLSHGAETVNIVLNPIWIAKFPFVYIKKYVNNLRAPNNGPLSPIKQNIQRKLAK